MAVVQGIREKVHLPLYDSLSVDGEKQIGDIEKSGTLKFFIDVQGKTKLETNLQSAGLLPHYNTFEARALRVVFSDLPPKSPTEPLTPESDFDVTDPDDKTFDSAGKRSDETGFNAANKISAKVELSIWRAMKLLAEARTAPDGIVELALDDDDGATINLQVAGAGFKRFKIIYTISPRQA